MFCTYHSQVSINDKFAGLSEALYIAERSAREQIRTRNELVKQKKQQEENVREQQLRDLAAKARAERTAIVNRDSKESDDGQRERAQIEKDRRRKVERELRLEVCLGSYCIVCYNWLAVYLAWIAQAAL